MPDDATLFDEWQLQWWLPADRLVLDADAVRAALDADAMAAAVEAAVQAVARATPALVPLSVTVAK